jgi:hypothetical protein
MKIMLPRIRLPRIGLPRPHWPRRDRPDQSVPAAPLPGTLRAFRVTALWAIAVLILAASAAAFAESYQGLYEWARHHGKTGIWATLYPLQIDVFIAVPELVLFVAMLDQWKHRHKAGAWVLAVVGLSVSVAGNIGHVIHPDLQSRATAAVPPLAAFAALWLGFTVVKRIIERRAELVKQDRERAEREAAGQAAREAEQTRLNVVLPEVPTDNEVAALLALRATAYAGNPWSGRQLETRFGLTRAQSARVRDLVLADANGHHPEDNPGDADR